MHYLIHSVSPDSQKAADWTTEDPVSCDINWIQSGLLTIKKLWVETLIDLGNFSLHNIILNSLFKETFSYLLDNLTSEIVCCNICYCNTQGELNLLERWK